MLLDPDVCERVRLARDAPFDGRFFIGVLTTSVYCRPIRRVRAATTPNLAATPKALAKRAEIWRPWRAYAAVALWHCEQAGIRPDKTDTTTPTILESSHVLHLSS